VKVGEALHGIGKSLFVDLGIHGTDTVADSAEVDCGKLEIHDSTPIETRVENLAIRDIKKII
jgi:hypothetical protein